MKSVSHTGGWEKEVACAACSRPGGGQRSTQHTRRRGSLQEGPCERVWAASSSYGSKSPLQVISCRHPPRRGFREALLKGIAESQPPWETVVKERQSVYERCSGWKFCSPSLYKAVGEGLSSGPGPEKTMGWGSNRWTAESPLPLWKKIRSEMRLFLMWVMLQSILTWVTMEMQPHLGSETGEAWVICDINKTAPPGHIGTLGT